jgi:hypothetical protein
VFPFLKITTDDVGAFFGKRRRYEESARPGPFLIVSVDSGLALDTAFHTTDLSNPHLWTAHGQLHQLWHLVPSGHAGEVRIESAGNGLFLDGQASKHPTMRGESDEAWQRWRLKPAPGRRAHLLVNAGTGLALKRPDDAERGTWPILSTDRNDGSQHWLLTVPFEPPPES